MEDILDIGTRVRLIRSDYTEHPSRMAGGLGTVIDFYDYYTYSIAVDNDPNRDKDQTPLWTFLRNELAPL